MTLDDQRRLSLKLFSQGSLNIDLYDYDPSITTDKDITDICSFLANYEDRFQIKLFNIDEENSRIVFNSSLLFSIFNFIRKLTPDNFEKFSAIICKSLGYTNYFATKKSHDQGVDFIAFKEYDDLKIDYKLHIIGQSKHFNSMLVDVKDIRELSGSIALFSRKEFYDTSTSYAQFEIGLFSPLQVVFISNYFFSNDAIILCQKAGIIPLDIIDIICVCTSSIINKELKWLNIKNSFSHPKATSELNKIKVLI